MELKVDNASVEKIVNEQIRVAVGEALAKQTPYLVERIVDEALRKKARDSYGREYDKTIIEMAVNKMIQAAATEAANEWLDEMKPQIKKLVHAKLAAKHKGLISSIADQMAASLGKGFEVSCYFRNRD